MAKASSKQQEVIKRLTAAEPGSVLVRYSGGFWAFPNSPMRVSFGTTVPEWYCGSETVRTLTRQGVLELAEGAQCSCPTCQAHQDEDHQPRRLAVAVSVG